MCTSYYDDEAPSCEHCSVPIEQDEDVALFRGETAAWCGSCRQWSRLGGDR